MENGKWRKMKMKSTRIWVSHSNLKDKPDPNTGFPTTDAH